MPHVIKGQVSPSTLSEVLPFLTRLSTEDTHQEDAYLAQDDLYINTCSLQHSTHVNTHQVSGDVVKQSQGTGITCNKKQYCTLASSSSALVSLVTDNGTRGRNVSLQFIPFPQRRPRSV